MGSPLTAVTKVHGCCGVCVSDSFKSCFCGHNQQRGSETAATTDTSDATERCAREQSRECKEGPPQIPAHNGHSLATIGVPTADSGCICIWNPLDPVPPICSGRSSPTPVPGFISGRRRSEASTKSQTDQPPDHRVAPLLPFVPAAVPEYYQLDLDRRTSSRTTSCKPGEIQVQQRLCWTCKFMTFGDYARKVTSRRSLWPRPCSLLLKTLFAMNSRCNLVH